MPRPACDVDVSSPPTGISHYAFLWVFLVILLFILIFASFWAYNRYVVRRKQESDNPPHG